MTRQDLRNCHPFHARNPRAHVACCLPRALPRRSFWRPFIGALVIISGAVLLALHFFGA
jgi:hypothetical protein